MTQEQFEALGIEKSLAKKAADESKKELEGYVAKETYDTTEQQRKQLETTVNDYKTQLDTLKASAGDNEALKKQIADLQEQNRQKDTEHQNELKTLKPVSYTHLPVVLVQEKDTPRIFDISTINTVDYRKNLIYREVMEDREKIVDAIKETKDNKKGINSIIKLLNLGKAQINETNSLSENEETNLLLY